MAKIKSVLGPLNHVFSEFFSINQAVNYIFKIRNSLRCPFAVAFAVCLIISLLFTVLQINEIVLQKGNNNLVIHFWAKAPYQWTTKPKSFDYTGPPCRRACIKNTGQTKPDLVNLFLFTLVDLAHREMFNWPIRHRSDTWTHFC